MQYRHSDLCFPKLACLYDARQLFEETSFGLKAVGFPGKAIIPLSHHGYHACAASCNKAG